MKCVKSVSWDSWHFHPCGKPAKYIYKTTAGSSEPLCGIHAKRYKGSPNLKVCPTKHAPDVVESAASVSIPTASEVSVSEADSTPATTQVM